MTDINGKMILTVGYLMRNTENLQKLCVEIAQFCRAVYASTQNEQERKIYFDMLEKLNKK